jgi:hypothetical protein
MRVDQVGSSAPRSSNRPPLWSVGLTLFAMCAATRVYPSRRQRIFCFDVSMHLFPLQRIDLRLRIFHPAESYSREEKVDARKAKNNSVT